MAYKRKKGKTIVKNRKKSYEFMGIDYKSTLEKNMAMLLTASNIPFEYEPAKYEVMEAFDFPFKSYERQSNGKGEFKDRGGKKVLGIKYTPDFVGHGFIIETKGFSNESFPMRWKMFKRLLADGFDPYVLVIYKPQKISECEETVKLIKKHNDERGTKGEN